MRSSDSVKKIVMTALFAALACAATMAIRIPIVGTGGYVHLGDAIVILSGILLGPAWGFLAAGVGSAMADLLGGYFIYVPITFAIKGLVALASGIVLRAVWEKPRLRRAAAIFGGLADIILVSGGYFVCEIPMYGLSAAAASVLPNAFQGLSGLVIASLLYPIMSSVPQLRRFAFSAGAHTSGKGV